MAKIIGVTGGIGSGKTTLTHFFKAAGISVYIADDAARKIMESSTIIAEIKKVFGSLIFENGVLNRQKLAEVVFNNPQQLQLLNTIIHPAVRKHFADWVSIHKDEAFVIYEAAILFESGSYKNCDQIITVTAPIEIRIQRVIARDHTTSEAVSKRINAQWTDAQRIEKSDFVVENTNLETTKLAVENILKVLKN